MDLITAKKKRLEYAKVCVEIEAGLPIPESVTVILKNGNKATVGIIVPWIPCSVCKLFGHNDKTCSKLKNTGKQNMIWQPKTVQPGVVLVAAESSSVAAESANIAAKIEKDAGQSSNAAPETVKDPKPVSEETVKHVPEVAQITNPELNDKSAAIKALVKGKKNSASKGKIASNSKNTFTSSSNRYELLNSIEDISDPVDSLDDDTGNELWAYLVDNAKISPPKRGTRAASKGVPILVNKINNKKEKIIAKAK